MRNAFAGLALAGGLLYAPLAQSQTQMPNGGFENWQNVGTSTEEPTNWNSNKTGGGFANLGPQTCYREATSPYAGTYCVRLETKNYLGTPVNGTATTGRIEAPTTNPNDGYIQTVRSNANFHSTFVGRPDSLVGYYKYTQAGSDRAKIEVILHGDYDVRTPLNGASTPYVVGTATFLGVQGNVTNWTRFSVPFDYVNGDNPMYILAVATASSSPASAANGSKLWLDELQVVYNPTIAISSLTPASPYYVTDATGASLNIAYTTNGTFNAGNVFTAQLSNASGSFASPVNIGSVTATSGGNISATIPAGTLSGTGYRIRIVSDNPAVVSPQSAAIEVIRCTNSIAPSAVQTLAAGTNGTALNVTESTTALSREWRFGTSPGGPYNSFAPTQTGASYTPNFAAAGTYYVVCVSTFSGGVSTTSNEVQINVVQNSIAPATSQSILVGVNGTLLTVTETPAGSTREWKFATAAGGPYGSFGPAQTGMTYTPNFAAPGNYFVVCQSTISGLTVTSNEVQISVGAATITTGSVAGSPFEFSPSAPNASVSVPFTASGTFAGGNVFTAQLSDASGSFAAPTNIGTLAGTGSGTINATIAKTTPAGNGYRIRVVSSNPVVNGSDNGSNLVIDQFNNSIAPIGVQNTTAGVAGSTLTVSESQNAASRQWRYSTVSGSGYQAFTPAQTGVAYAPLFQMPGTYYVVCTSTNQYGDAVNSNEVQVIVGGGTALTTTTVTNSPYLISPSAQVQAVVNFTSNAVYNAGNVFSVQVSDASGSFGNPIVVGTLSATAPAPITTTIPNNLPSGNGYRMRVVSSNPALVGTDNGTDLSVVPFESMLSPMDTQTVAQNQNGMPITVTTTHPATHEWKARETILTPYLSFVPAQTGSSYTPNFPLATTQYLVCQSVNSWGDTITAGEIVIIVTVGGSTTSWEQSAVRAYWAGNDLVFDASQADLSADAFIELFDASGRALLQSRVSGYTLQRIATDLPSGVYALRLNSGNDRFGVQLMKR